MSATKYVVVDLEMCKVCGKASREEFGYGTELIQIGAVLLDENYRIMSSFCSFVRPEYGHVDRYIQKLTGISEEDVKDADRASTILERFAEWVDKDAVMVSWSYVDRAQIKHEMSAKGIRIAKLEAMFDSWIDCQKIFSDKMLTRKAYKLSEALIYGGIDYAEGAHDALVDANNTALLFAKMNTEEDFASTCFFKSEEQEEEHLSYKPFAGLLKLLEQPA